MVGAEGFEPPTLSLYPIDCLIMWELFIANVSLWDSNFCSSNWNPSRPYLCLWLGSLGFFLARVVFIPEETTLAASKFAFWNYLALQLRGSRYCFLSSIKIFNTDRECFLVGFLWIKCCCSTHLGLSVLCPAQFHTCHNLSRADGASYSSSSFLNLQGIQSHGTSSYSLSNLGDNRSHSGLGLPD